MHDAYTVFTGCCREEHMLLVFENSAEEYMWAGERQSNRRVQKLHKQQLHDLHFSPDIM
jgi:hypothetical protein